MSIDHDGMHTEDESRDELREVYFPERSGGESLRRYTSIPVTLAAFIAGGMVTSVIAITVGMPILDGLGFYSFLAIPIGVVAIVASAQKKALAKERTVLLTDGQVSLITSTEKETHPFDQCCWFQGPLKDDTQFAEHPFRGEAILLVFPSGRKVACGLTEPFTKLWLEKLEEYHCRRVLRQEGMLGCLILLLSMGSAFVGGFAGWHFGRFLLTVLIPIPPRDPIVNLFPAAMCMFFIWLGAIWQFFIPGWRRNTKREKEQYQRAALMLPIKLGIGIAFVATNNAMASIMMGAFISFVLFGLTAKMLKTPVTRNLPFPD